MKHNAENRILLILKVRISPFCSLSSTCFTTQVNEVDGEDVSCLIKNSATLSGSLYTLHVSQIRIDLPTLTDKDKEVTKRTVYIK